MNSKEELLDKIEEIGTIKGKLSFRDRALTSSYGLYVQSGRLPGGAMQYMAGGKLLKKLVFVREADGTRIVKKYHAGDWKLKVDETLALCRYLEQASQTPRAWALEKVAAYEAEEPFNPVFVTKVDKAWQEHDSQLNEVWHLTGPEQRKDLMETFRKELEQEWPIEYFEILLENVVRATTERVITSIRMAYIAGYMVGKDWISLEELSDFNLCLGDNLAAHIRSTFRRAKSKGIAFASAFACVGAKGTEVALSSGMQNYEPTKHEIIEELLRMEGFKLVRRHFDHPESLGPPTVEVNPFNPTDSQYLTETLLGSRHFETERLGNILKKLLKDDYDRYYEAAKQRIISSRR